MRCARVAGGVFAACLMARAAGAQPSLAGDRIQIHRAPGRITIDGDLADEGWRQAARIDKWYETQPGDNVAPKVRNVGYLTYDERFLYAAFEFEAPNPAAMRAPFADRDNIGNGLNDYGGVILHARKTPTTAPPFVVTPRHIQYDPISDDASAEDAPPRLFLQSGPQKPG